MPDSTFLDTLWNYTLGLAYYYEIVGQSGPQDRKYCPNFSDDVSMSKLRYSGIFPCFLIHHWKPSAHMRPGSTYFSLLAHIFIEKKTGLWAGKNLWCFPAGCLNLPLRRPQYPAILQCRLDTDHFSWFLKWRCAQMSEASIMFLKYFAIPNNSG